MIRFQFVDDNLADYSVKRMCTVLGLNRSSYYKWKNSAPRRRARLVDDAVVAAEIQAIFDAENGVWGARRITAELKTASATTALHLRLSASIAREWLV